MRRPSDTAVAREAKEKASRSGEKAWATRGTGKKNSTQWMTKRGPVGATTGSHQPRAGHHSSTTRSPRTTA